MLITGRVGVGHPTEPSRRTGTVLSTEPSAPGPDTGGGATSERQGGQKCRAGKAGVTSQEERVLPEVASRDYVKCFTVPTVQGEFGFRSEGCTSFDKAQMRESNYRSLTKKCTSRDCRRVWAAFDDAHMPQYSVCRRVTYTCKKVIALDGTCSDPIPSGFVPEDKCDTQLDNTR